MSRRRRKKRKKRRKKRRRIKEIRRRVSPTRKIKFVRKTGSAMEISILEKEELRNCLKVRKFSNEVF